MTSHVDGHDVILRSKVWRNVVERVRDASDAMQHDERRFLRRSPVEIVNSQAIDRDETIDRLRGLRSSRAANSRRPRDSLVNSSLHRGTIQFFASNVNLEDTPRVPDVLQRIRIKNDKIRALARSDRSQ